MKTTLFLIILALAINGFSQNLPSSTFEPHPSPASMNNGHGGKREAGDITTDIYSGKNFGKTIKQQTPGQLTSVQRNDSIYVWRWDTAIIGWTIESKIINIDYDANNNLIFNTFQNWIGSTWVNANQTSYTYDANNYTASELNQNWNGSSWINTDQFTYTYDANNNLTSAIVQSWGGSAWVNSSLISYTYDAFNNKLIESYLSWKGSTWRLEVQRSYDYTYDANNNIIIEMEVLTANSSFIYHHLYTFTYDDNNNQTGEVIQYPSVDTLVNIYKYTSTYDVNNNLTSEVRQDWIDSIWVNYTHDNYTYDANNNQTNFLDQKWNGSAWVNFTQSAHSFATNNFLQNKTNKFFDGTGTILPYINLNDRISYSDSTQYYFNAIMGTNKLTADDGRLSVYPNPSSGKFTISSNTAISAIEIYNLLGERIYTDYKIKQHNSLDVDLSNQVKGIYIINIYYGKLMYNRKFVVQ